MFHENGSLAAAQAIAYPAGEWRALRLRAEAARRRGRTDVVIETEQRLGACLAALAATLPDDELRRALYAAAAVGHDRRP